MRELDLGVVVVLGERHLGLEVLAALADVQLDGLRETELVDVLLALQPGQDHRAAAVLKRTINYP